MTVAPPSTWHVRSQVEALCRQVPDARFIGIRSPAPGAWTQVIESAGRRFQIRWCGSSLEVREALCADTDDGVVILTDRTEADLGGDVLARLARGRLIDIESWRMLREVFQARQIDPRLRGCDWMADLLLENQPPEGFPPVAGGILDADSAWRALLSSALGLEGARPDLDTLLHWTLSDDGLYRFAQLPQAARTGIADHLRRAAGDAGGLVVDAILAGHGGDAVALGLVCGVVFSDGWTETDLVAAAVRLEPLVGRSQIPAVATRPWTTAATRVVGRSNVPARALFEDAEKILTTLHAFPHVARSMILPAAFNARMEAAAAAIDRARAESHTPHAVAGAEAACQQVFSHGQAVQQSDRSERLRMALRLLRWLARPTTKEQPPAADLPDLALTYITEGSHVDWARGALLGGDELAVVSRVYVQLAADVRALRERQNQAFAQALQTWNARPGADGPLTPIETVLDRIVAGAASKAPVLALVLDGMSFPVFRQLAADIANDGWNELAIDGSAVHAAVSVVPTVTEVARTSLLCGRLCQGSASTETAGFASHPALLRHSRSGAPPILFHKGDLNAGGVLSDPVRTTLGDVRQRIVGIVYNAVDDHLSGAEQARPTWSLDTLQLLRPIFHEARNAGRLVIMMADHGHVVEDGTRQSRKGGGDRWRPFDDVGDVGEGEVLLGGSRVLTPDGGQTVVVPWSEQVRYGTRKAGYHGGAAPQEVLVPTAAFSAATTAPVWDFAPPIVPEWWHQPVDTAVPETAAPAPRAGRKPRRRRHEPPPGTAPALPFADLPPSPAPETAPVTDWVSRLLTCEIYAAQRRLVGKGAAGDTEVGAVLAALARRGRMPRTVLAQHLGVPLFRLNGLLSSVRRVINLDQTPILVVEDVGDWVTLDVKLLAAQFELSGPVPC